MNDGGIVIKRLKKMRNLIPIVVFDEDCYIQNIGRFRNRIINTTMERKFGNGKEYSFRSDCEGEYTHRCLEDNYCYHESWFECDIDYTLESELFEL